MLHPPCALVAFGLNLYQTQTQLETKCYQQTPPPKICICSIVFCCLMSFGKIFYACVVDEFFRTQESLQQCSLAALVRDCF